MHVSSLRFSASSLLAVLIGLLPVFLLTTGGGSSMFYAIALASLVVAASRPAEALARLRPYRALVLWLCLPLAAALFSQAVNGTWRGAGLERGVRISLVFPVLLAALLMLEARILRLALAGPAVAGAASALVVFALAWPDFERPQTPQYNAVTYGNLMLLMAVATLYSLWWPFTRRPGLERAVKVAAATLAFAGFILTQTRTGWMAIPVFAIIGILLKGRPRHPLRDLAALAGILAVAAAIGVSSPALRERVQQGVDEIHQCRTVDRTADTSMCIRLQLWHATWDMFVARPWSGTGGGSYFSDELEKRVPRGEVSRFVADNFGEPHNDMLLALSLHGLAGGLGLLALYLAPAWLFLRRLLRFEAPAGTRVAAAIGLALCLGFAIFGITELMFRGMRSLGFYVVFLALAAALSDPRQGPPPRAA